MKRVIIYCDRCRNEATVHSLYTTQIKLTYRGIDVDLCEGCVNEFNAWWKELAREPLEGSE